MALAAAIPNSSHGTTTGFATPRIAVRHATSAINGASTEAHVCGALPVAVQACATASTQYAATIQRVRGRADG